MGSNLIKVPYDKVPRVQAALYSIDANGRLTGYLGSAVRLMDWLIAPKHVVAPYEKVAILVLKPNQTPEAHQIKTKLFDEIDGDIVAARLDEAVFSRLGLVKASIATMEGEMIVSVCSTSKEPEMSFGTVSHDEKIFGSVVYHGSTKGGFSGSAYIAGKQLVGIHLGGGVMNYGVAASYVAALLRKHESTAEWLEKVRRQKGNRLKYQRSKFNPDEAIVFVDGRYHTIDLSLLEEDEETPMGDIYAPDTLKVPEVNLDPMFPPQYVDIARPIVEAINEGTAELQSKNLQLAEQCSAEQAEAFMQRYNHILADIDERMLLLQSLQDSVGNRYREVQRLLMETPKDAESRKVLVAENEGLKKEAMQIKKLKTDANVEISSVRAIPKPAKRAKAKKERAAIIEKVSAEFNLQEVAQALIEAGLVAKLEIRDPADKKGLVVAHPVGSAVTIPASAGEDPNGGLTNAWGFTESVWNSLPPDSQKIFIGRELTLQRLTSPSVTMEECKRHLENFSIQPGSFHSREF